MDGLPKNAVSVQSRDVCKTRVEAIGCRTGDSKFGEGGIQKDAV